MSSTDLDRAERARALDDFANAAGQRNQPRPPAMRWCGRPPASPSAWSALSRSPSNAKKPRSSTSSGRSPPPPGQIGSIAIRSEEGQNEETGQDEWVTD